VIYSSISSSFSRGYFNFPISLISISRISILENQVETGTNLNLTRPKKKERRKKEEKNEKRSSNKRRKERKKREKSPKAKRDGKPELPFFSLFSMASYDPDSTAALIASDLPFVSSPSLSLTHYPLDSDSDSDSEEEVFFGANRSNKEKFGKNAK
jgi:hypothetical protein